jgi:hypothetical protein
MALRNGSRLHVSMNDVFPDGCHLVPDSIVEAIDYDEATGRRSPAVDKHTGQPVWQCRVADMDPELAGRQRETVVKILADKMPVPPTRTPFELVEFEGLQVTPYVDSGRCQGKGKCQARIAFSLRATGMKAARPVSASGVAPTKDAA